MHAPFKYLPLVQRKELAGMCRSVRLREGEILLKQGVREGDRVFLLVKGRVNVVDESYLPPRVMGTGAAEMGSKAIFGEREVILKSVNSFSVVADEGGCECLVMSASVFLALTSISKPFASSTALITRGVISLFRTSDILVKEIENIILAGEVSWDKFKQIYAELNSIMHPFCLDEQRLDLNALLYCIRRLPSNVSRTHLWILGRQRPEVIDPHGIFLLTSSPARRRAAWDMSNGSTFVLVSDALTDIVDLLCCLCCYSIEAKKVRRRLSAKQKSIGTILYKALQQCIPENEPLQLQREVLAPYFSEDEFNHLCAMWPKSVMRRCYEMLIHHENFSFKVQKVAISQVLPIDIWSENIRLAALDMFFGDIENISVSLISSNTHSVVNLISPWVHKNKELILDWGKKTQPNAFNVQFPHDDDLVYYLLYYYMKEFPDCLSEKVAFEREHGMVTLQGELDGTGISVQLINPDLLDANYMDAAIPEKSKKKLALDSKVKRLIINIDFAFGKQAETILDELILLFGTNIRSINVFGKAGALVGKRGDVLLPTHFIMFNEDNPKAVINRDVDFNRIVQLSNAHCDVWNGPVITVLGTLVQNADMLHYFEQLWHCIGLEMEGSYYSRAMERGIMRGLLLPTVKSRFLYYVSDVPLAVSENLTRRLEPWEGIPPLYLISRAVCESVMQLGDLEPVVHVSSILAMDQTKISAETGKEVSLPNSALQTLQEAATTLLTDQSLVFEN